jgi:hypothetical protein
MRAQHANDMEKTSFSVKDTGDGRFWAHNGPLPGTPADMAVQALLDWIVEQIRFGNITAVPAAGESLPDTVVIGRQAAWAGSEADAAAQARNAIDASAGEGSASEDVSAGVAATHTRALLQEAARCNLFGLPRACIACCRTVLEDLLSERVPPFELAKEPAKAASLMRLINAAVRLGVLPVELAGKAHGIRIKADEALHNAGTLVDDPRQMLLDTRLIVDELYSIAKR